MLALAAIYSAVFLGPWGELKPEALLATPVDAARHALLVVGGAGRRRARRSGSGWRRSARRRRRSARRLTPARSGRAPPYALVPLGLAGLGRLHRELRPGLGTYVALDASPTPSAGAGTCSGWRPPGRRSCRASGPGCSSPPGSSGSSGRRESGCGQLDDSSARVGRAGGRASWLPSGLALATGGLVWLGLG